MSTPDFTLTFTVDQTPEQVFAAVTDVRGWWSLDIEGLTDQLGGEFTYLNGDVHRSTMRVVELVPGRTVAWLCTDNRFGFVADQTEWVGNTLRFDITPAGDRTELRFTQVGLVPAYDCYNACANAWTGYVGESLKSLIETGEGDRDNEVRNARAGAAGAV